MCYTARILKFSVCRGACKVYTTNRYDGEVEHMQGESRRLLGYSIRADSARLGFPAPGSRAIPLLLPNLGAQKTTSGILYVVGSICEFQKISGPNVDPR